VKASARHIYTSHINKYATTVTVHTLTTVHRVQVTTPPPQGEKGEGRREKRRGKGGRWREGWREKGGGEGDDGLRPSSSSVNGAQPLPKITVHG